jgi:hypothetical protein
VFDEWKQQQQRQVEQSKRKRNDIKTIHPTYKGEKITFYLYMWNYKRRDRKKYISFAVNKCMKREFPKEFHQFHIPYFFGEIVFICRLMCYFSRILLHLFVCLFVMQAMDEVLLRILHEKFVNLSFEIVVNFW